VAITDLLASVTGYHEALADAVGITDALSHDSNYELVIADTVNVADAVQLAADYIRALDDNMLLTDLAVPILFVGGQRKWLAVRLTADAITVVALDAERLADVRLDAEAAGIDLKAERAST
jgi:hypothetical protein